MDNSNRGLKGIENDILMISKKLFIDIIDGNEGIKPELWRDISIVIGNNVYKRCCANCQHSLVCKIKDYVLHELLLDAKDYECNLYMLGKVNYTKKEV